MSGLSEPPLLERRIHIVQGENYVADDPSIVLSTILGSCVAACLHDPAAGIGGMNHFLLPGDHRGDAGGGGNAMRYGVHAMELLVNSMLQRGAQRSRMEAKLFGGARMMKGLTDVGELNAAFAERFLQAEGIPVRGGSLRGDRGRRIQFWPCSGRARQIVLAANQDSVFSAERTKAPPPMPAQGSVELF